MTSMSNSSSESLSKTHSYEECLDKARVQGWREPYKVADLEIAAYAAGVRMERNRVLSILQKAVDGESMRIIDLQRFINKIESPNGK